MTRPTTDLARFSNHWYSHGAGRVKRALWFIANAVLLRNPANPSSRVKVLALRAFGARVGTGVVIKPAVNVKYPWFLVVGDYCWIGEGVWIDNLAPVTLGKHCCLSQGALLLCGNHDYTKPTFDLVVGRITLEDGVWIGALAVVCPGVTLHSHAMLTVHSVATRDLEAYGVYSGNPARHVRPRVIIDASVKKGI